MTGDATDIKARLKAAFPAGWAADVAEVFSAALAGEAYGLAFVYSLLQYVKQQSRLATMTGGWLDIFAADFFGDGLLRLSGESDADYRARIQTALFEDKLTRSAISAAVQRVAGVAPVMVEVNRPADTLAYGIPQFGYGASGYYGSTVQHHQGFLSVAYSGDPQNIYAAIERVKAFGTIVWTNVH